MTLREKIEKIILENQDNPKISAIEICKMLDDEISLSGNGWFDDDPIMIEELEAE